MVTVIMSVEVFFLWILLLLLNFLCRIIVWAVISEGVVVCRIYFYIIIYWSVNIMTCRFGRWYILFFVMISYRGFILEFFRRWFVFVRSIIFLCYLYFLRFECIFVCCVVIKRFVRSKRCNRRFCIFSWWYFLFWIVMLESGICGKFGYGWFVRFFSMYFMFWNSLFFVSNISGSVFFKWFIWFYYILYWFKIRGGFVIFVSKIIYEGGVFFERLVGDRVFFYWFGWFCWEYFFLGVVEFCGCVLFYRIFINLEFWIWRFDLRMFVDKIFRVVGLKDCFIIYFFVLSSWCCVWFYIFYFI